MRDCVSGGNIHERLPCRIAVALCFPFKEACKIRTLGNLNGYALRSINDEYDGKDF